MHQVHETMKWEPSCRERACYGSGSGEDEDEGDLRFYKGMIMACSDP